MFEIIRAWQHLNSIDKSLETTYRLDYVSLIANDAQQLLLLMILCTSIRHTDFIEILSRNDFQRLFLFCKVNASLKETTVLFNRGIYVLFVLIVKQGNDVVIKTS